MKKLTTMIMLGLLAASPNLLAAKIYKWTDKEGNVHYGERAPTKNAREMTLRKGPVTAPPTTPAANTGTPDDKPAAKKNPPATFLETIAREREEKQKAVDKAAREKALKDKNCSGARKNLASLQQGAPLFELDEKGERQYLDAPKIQQRTRQAEKDVAKWCN